MITSPVYLVSSRRWRYLQLCFNFLRTLVRYDQPLPARATAIIVSYLNHDSLAIRKVGQEQLFAMILSIHQKKSFAKILCVYFACQFEIAHI